MRDGVVVKLGGSLYDATDLGPRLRAWLDARPERRVVLVPGGGPMADVVRDLDTRHHLGEESAEAGVARSTEGGGEPERASPPAAEPS